tara:strand:+ start:475 stop:903 length:429 start_codon:yes stop_codon:yes gene_type:complete
MIPLQGRPFKFYSSTGIQICIALSDPNNSNFSNILREIIKKSLFTERQIEIILKSKNLSDIEFTMTKGAYYRQVSQSREKLSGLYYSFIVLGVLGIVLPDDIDVISELSERMSVIKDGDVFPEKEQEIISVIERVVKQTTGM